MKTYNYRNQEQVSWLEWEREGKAAGTVKPHSREEVEVSGSARPFCNR